MIFVDTNYFLRFLLADIDFQYLETKRLFAKASKRELELCSSTVVFFEIYWVLESFYEKKKRELVAILKNILSMGLVNFEERTALHEALRIFEIKSVSLEDSYNLAYARLKAVSDFRTFDKKLLREWQKKT